MSRWRRLIGRAAADRPGRRPGTAAPAARGDGGSPDGAAPVATVAADAGESVESVEPVQSLGDRERRPETPTLLRHSPFTLGFFGAIGAMVAIFLAEQVRSISSIIILMVLALFLAIGLDSAVVRLVAHGWRRGVAMATVLAGVLAVLAGFVSTVAPVISDQIELIVRNAPGWLDALQQNQRVQRLDEQFDIITRVKDYVQQGDFGASVFGGALGVGLAVLSAVANSFIVIILMVYFLASLPSIKEAGYRLAPASRRPRVRELGERVLRSTSAYVSGAFVVALLAGFSTLVFSWLIGLGEYSFALAFIVALLSLIPVVGAFVSGAIVTALALTVSPTTALVALIYYVAYQQFESYVIYPRIMKRAVDMPGSITVVAALIGGALLGIIGALLAVPVAAMLLLLHREVFLRRQDAR